MRPDQLQEELIDNLFAVWQNDIKQTLLLSTSYSPSINTNALYFPTISSPPTKPGSVLKLVVKGSWVSESDAPVNRSVAVSVA
jgi:hypothetical protein